MLRTKQKVLSVVLTISVMTGGLTTFAKADALTTSQSQSSNSNVTTTRITGSSKYGTADVIAEKGWTQADTVVIASGVDFPDGLCAGPIAKKYNAPILLASATGLSDETLSEITKLKAKKAVIIGGEGAVPSSTETQLNGIGITSIQRIGGTDRYNTSVLAAEQLDKPSAVVVTSGENFPDSLSISAIASQLGMPIIIASKDGLSDEAISYIKNSGATKTYIAGGNGVLSSSIENQVPNPTRLSGEDRYATNLAVLNQFASSLKFENVYLATGDDFADALVGSELAAQTQSPVVLTNNSLTSGISKYLAEHMQSSTKVVAIGDNNAVADSLIEKAMNPSVASTSDTGNDTATSNKNSTDAKMASCNTSNTFDKSVYKFIPGIDVTNMDSSSTIKYNDTRMLITEEGKLYSNNSSLKLKRSTSSTIKDGSSQSAKINAVFTTEDNKKYYEDANSYMSYYGGAITIAYQGSFFTPGANNKLNDYSSRTCKSNITKNSDGNYEIASEETIGDTSGVKRTQSYKGIYNVNDHSLKISNNSGISFSSTITIKDFPCLIFDGIRIGEKEFSYLDSVDKAFSKGSDNYNYLRSQIADMQSNIDVTSMLSQCNNDTTVFDNYVCRILDEFPEYYLYECSTDVSNGEATLTITYSEKDQVKKMKEKLDYILPKITKPGMTDYEKEKFIHDYIVLNTEYDKNDKGLTESNENYTAYGPIANGRAVCQGYEAAFEFLCKLAGLDCIEVVGKVNNAKYDNHAWNIVKIDGKYYHVDTTWDDTEVNNGIGYDYFNIDDATMSKDHSWDKSQYPECKTSLGKTN
ncbi:cell wall-binding repeat-containing protein [Clostridium drakei]|nr:cell wall-binding repeat-containing protein [Clostridium drakei]